jgi:hypothetical protein
VRNLLADVRVRNYLAVAALVLLGALSMAKHWGGPISWETDALFYQATTQQIEGESAQEARRDVFGGPLSDYERRIERENPDEPSRVSDPAWVEYSSAFYARRLLLPGLAALISPVLGIHALLDLSLLGFALIPGLLFLLMRRKFTFNLSFIVGLAVILWPPLRAWSVFPLSDSIGLALLIASLVCGALTFEKDRRWLWPWAACVLALGFTRDLAFMPVIGALCLLAVRRDRLSAALSGAGIVAAIPPLLLHGLSQAESLTYVYADHTIPTDTGWGAAISGYPGNFGHMIGRYADYATGHPGVILLTLLGVASAFVLARHRRDPFTILLWSTFPAYLLMILIGPAFSAFRYELVLVPLMAYGYGLLGERALARFRRPELGSPPAESKLSDTAISR